MQTEVIMTGIGGQGVQLAAKTLATAGIAEGRQAMISAHWGGEMRGGQTEASVVLADGRLRALPILPSTWAAFVMHFKFWPEVRDRVRPDGIVVFNEDIVTTDLGLPSVITVPVPATTISTDLGARMGTSFVMLGAFCGLTELVSVESLVTAMRSLVPPYRTQHIEANETSIRAGHEWAQRPVVSAWMTSGRDASPVGGAP